MQMQTSPGLAWWTVRREADRRGAHHVRLVPAGGRVECLFDAGRAQADEPVFSDAVLPVLAMRLQRLGARSGWHFEIHQAGFAPAIHLIRRRSDTKPTHPSDWAQAYRLFRENPEGLLVLIQPDAYLVRHGLLKLKSAAEAGDWRSHDDLVPDVYDADDETGRELALQAALAGRSAVAVGSVGNDWWEPVTGTVAVRVLRAHRTPHGLAWEAF